MKKFIKSYLAVLTILTAVLINGCDAFESFQFGLPAEFEITSDGTNNPMGSSFFCFDNDETYQDYEDDIQSITYVAAYIVTLEVAPASLTGDAYLRVYEGTNEFGSLLFEHVANNLTPAEHDSTNAYKLELTSAEITDLNASLAGGNRCFYGEYEVRNITGGGSTNHIKIRLDVLFNVEAEL